VLAEKNIMSFLLLVLLLWSPISWAARTCDELMKQLEFVYDSDTNSFLLPDAESHLKAKELTPVELRLSREARKEWDLSESLEEDARAIFDAKDMSDQEKQIQFFALMADARLNMITEKQRTRVLKTQFDEGGGDSLYSRTAGALLAKYAGPHYTPFLNRIGKASGELDETSESFVSLRLLEQAIQRNTKPASMAWTFLRSKEALMALPTPATPLGKFNMEARAMGAQWEAASRMPLVERQKLLAKLKPEADAANEALANASALEKMNPQNYGPRRTARVHNLVRDATIAALENAHLPKDQFLREVMPAHQFRLGQLMRRHYAGTWRFWIVGLSGGALGMMASSDKEEDRKFYKDRVPAMDLKFFYDQIESFLKNDE